MKRRGRRRSARWPLATVAVCALTIILLVISTPTAKPANRFVIILDTLSNAASEKSFAARCHAILEPAGYTVEAYTGENVTVERVKSLNASPIIEFRVHSSVFDDGVWFYTGEQYSNTEHVLKQFTNELHIGRISPASNFTFAVGSTFIRNNLSSSTINIFSFTRAGVFFYMVFFDTSIKFKSFF